MTLQAQDVSMGFDGTGVLADVSVDVNQGEVLTIVGPSGTGKTTLLRLLAAFRPPASGTIMWENTDIWSLSSEERLAIRRRMSMVFQEPCLFNAPVHRNVTYGSRVREPWSKRIELGLHELVGRQPMDDTVRDVLETVSLTDKADQNALSLSGGEAQRVAFARALAVDPDIMLLDEPTSNLDPRNTAVLEGAIGRARDRGVGIVVATHDMHQAERISDRVGFILGGELVELGPTERLFEEPSDPRTAKFIDGELMYDETEDPAGQAA